MTTCNAHHAQPAKFDSQEENDFAANMIGTKSEVLIGYKAGKWADGTAPSDWSPKFSKHKKGGECNRLTGSSHSWEAG